LLTQCADFSTSDKNLKEQIQDLVDASAVVSTLRGCTFRWKDGSPLSIEANTSAIPPSAAYSIGFIAQDLKERVPGAVREVDGWLAVEYSALVPYYVEALKEHGKRISELEALSHELQSLQQAIASLSHSLPPVLPQKSAKQSTRLHAPKKQKVSSPCMLWNRLRQKYPSPILWLLLGGIFFVLLLAIVLSIVFALPPLSPVAEGTPSAQAAPPGAVPSFRPKNYVVDGGFEDPTSNSWSSNASFMSYRSSIIPDGQQMLSSAPFDAGSAFLLMNTSMGPQALHQTVNVSLWSPAMLLLTVWVYVPFRYDPAYSSLVAKIERVPSSNSTDANLCSAFAYANVSTYGVWQQLSVGLRCPFAPDNQFNVSILAQGPLFITAVDGVELIDSSTLSISVAGRLDFRFGSQGESQLRFPQIEPFSGRLSSFHFVPDGIIVGVLNLKRRSADADISVVKLYTNRSIDYTFGSSGHAVIPGMMIDTSYSVGDFVDVDHAGRVVVTGFCLAAGSTTVACVARLNRNGSLDVSFGSGLGLKLLPFTVGAVSAVRGAGFFVRSLADNTVVVGASSVLNATFHAVRLTKLSPAGNPDLSFGQSGSVSFPSFDPGRIGGAAVDSFGNIYIGKSYRNQFRILKVLGTSGSVDVSYGLRGVASVSVNFSTAFMTALTATAVRLFLHEVCSDSN
jgi:hypothetical protein